uniref:Uncharacterized protein n=1 Tax=viral metagenome TaxID=1070528 RepID=A0A6C0HR83_9ZZZZ
MSPYTDFVKKQMAVMGNSIPAKERMKEIAKLWHKQKMGSGMPPVKGATKKKSSSVKKKSSSVKKKSSSVKKKSSSVKKKSAIRRKSPASVKSSKKKSKFASKKKTEKKIRKGPTMHAIDGAGKGPTQGNDGKMWISQPDKNNVYHWKPYKSD